MVAVMIDLKSGVTDCRRRARENSPIRGGITPPPFSTSKSSFSTFNVQLWIGFQVHITSRDARMSVWLHAPLVTQFLKLAVVDQHQPVFLSARRHLNLCETELVGSNYFRAAY